MTRIVSYNILAGGYSLREDGGRRTPQLTRIIRSAQPDIVGIIEATRPGRGRPTVVEEIAEALGMQLIMGGEEAFENDYRIALLTRLPVISTKIHPRPGILTKPLLEVCVEEANGEHLTAFVTHLSAAFNKGRGGGGLRLREAQEIVKIMAPLRQHGKPHFLMGDFNALAPGDPFKAHHLLRYIVKIDQMSSDPNIVDGNPHLNAVVPRQLRFLKPLLRAIPQTKLLNVPFDWAASLYVPRASVGYFSKAGYTDCYRRLHPHEWGFTCPAGDPAGRIDYIFASPDLVERLAMCQEVIEGDGLPGNHASDHLALAAEFGPRVEKAGVQGAASTLAGRGRACQ